KDDNNKVREYDHESRAEALDYLVVKHAPSVSSKQVKQGIEGVLRRRHRLGNDNGATPKRTVFPIGGSSPNNLFARSPPRIATLEPEEYLDERFGQKLKLFYFTRQMGYDGQWGAFNSSSLTIDHVFGTVFRTSL